MIVYCCNRTMKVLGSVANDQKHPRIVDDSLVDELSSGIKSLELTVEYGSTSRSKVSDMFGVGNYLVTEYKGQQVMFTIIDSEIDSEAKTVYTYSEDAGLDLLNEIVPAYEASQQYAIEEYIRMFTNGSGFEIGINEIPERKRTLKWDAESTAAERIQSVANSFGVDLDYSVDIVGLHIQHLYINIYRSRGSDAAPVRLWLGKQISRIVEKRSVAELITAVHCVGGTPEASSGEDEPDPVTLDGYEYDDGDFFVSGGTIFSRMANERWSRWLASRSDVAGLGYIWGTFSYDTLSQSELFNRGLNYLKAHCSESVSYDIDIINLPNNVPVGSVIIVADGFNNVFVQSRLIKLETSTSSGKTTGELSLSGSNSSGGGGSSSGGGGCGIGSNWVAGQGLTLAGNVLKANIYNVEVSSNYDGQSVGQVTVNGIPTSINLPANILQYIGRVATPQDLPLSGNLGDVYDIASTGMNVVWNGTNWDALGETTTALTNSDIDSICI